MAVRTPNPSQTVLADASATVANANRTLLRDLGILRVMVCCFLLSFDSRNRMYHDWLVQQLTVVPLTVIVAQKVFPPLQPFPGQVSEAVARDTPGPTKAPAADKSDTEARASRTSLLEAIIVSLLCP